MLGEVFPTLRAISVEWSDYLVKFFAYVDGELADEDAESLSCIAAEVTADFWSGVEIEYEVVRIDSPVRIPDTTRTRVFQRRELA
jgi:hypothetical protein